MLTQKQLDLLTFIHKRTQRDGVPPSFDEMKEALSLRSKSGIHRLITALEERGFIHRLAHRARAIEVVKLPEGLGGPAARANVIEHDFRAQEEDRSSMVPLKGRIAAGTPISAIEQTVDQIPVPPSMLTRSADHYALEVKGDSMIDLGILEGDLVVVRQQDAADNGDIVVALVDDQEATLKTLRRDGPTIELCAANAAHQNQRYAADRVRIQGRMVGLIRTY